MGLLTQSEYTSLHTIFSSFPTISPSTLRRDLQALTAQGRVILLRGGAKLPDEKERYDLPIDSKLLIHTRAKKRMAACAASLVGDSDVIYLDSSSSVYPILQYIKAKDVTVVTSGIYTVLRAVKLGFRCLAIGGEVRGDVGSVVGSETEAQLRGLHFHLAFMSANGLSERHGVTTPHAGEAAKIRIVRERSDRTFFLMDGSKHGLSFTYRASEPSESEIISDCRAEFEGVFRSYRVAEEDGLPAAPWEDGEDAW